MAVAFDGVEISIRVESDLVRRVQRSQRRGASITGIALLTVAGNRGDPATLQIETPDSSRVDFAEIQRPVGTRHDTVGIVDRGLRSLDTSLAGACGPVARNGADALLQCERESGRSRQRQDGAHEVTTGGLVHGDSGRAMSPSRRAHSTRAA